MRHRLSTRSAFQASKPRPGNDLLGFHVQYHCNNFLDTVDRTLESRVDYEHFAAWRGGRPTYVRPFPISIDPSLWRVNTLGGRRSGLRLYDLRPAPLAAANP